MSLSAQDSPQIPPEEQTVIARLPGFLERWLAGQLTGRTRIDADTARVLRSSDGRSILYVMSSASAVDYLLTRGITHQLNLPMPGIAWENLIPIRGGAMAVRTLLRRLFDRLESDGASLMFLKKPGLFAKPARWNTLVWEELIRAQRKGKVDLLLVPVAFVWGKKPDHLKASIWDTLLGDTSSPGSIRKIFMLLRYFRQLSVHVGKPIELKTFLESVSESKDEVQAKKIRRLLSTHLYRERRLIAGPPLRSRDRVVSVLLKDPELKTLVAGVARREKKTEPEVWKRAESILRELISDYSQTNVEICYRIFRWLWNRLYDGLHIDAEGLERVKEVVKDYPVILIPSHKSHMDYMLLSAIFYENNMMPPHIAAGVNLAFWPMENVFRRNGAFFIRRKISGDLLYARLLALYIRWLIRTGYSQEFFIEGGRSRTGKLVFPKHGLLSIQVDAFLEGAARDLYVVPISVTYEKVVEETSYRLELSGQEKIRENVWSLLKTRKFLGKSHGSAYVRFSPPISLKEYFNLQGQTPIPTKIRRAKTLELAKTVTREIAAQTVVTTTALTATALLAQRERGVVESVLRERIEALLKFLSESNVNQSPEVADLPRQLPKLLQFFLEHRWIAIGAGDEGDRLIIIREDKRLTLDYYKNTILHFFLAPSIVAAAQSDEDIPFLQGIFHHEFFMKEGDDSEMIRSRGSAWVLGDDQRKTRQIYAGLIMNYLESYDLAAQLVLKEKVLAPPLSAEAIQLGLALGNRLFATGDITRREALSSANLQSAVLYFHEQGLLTEPTRLEEWRLRVQKILLR